MKPTLFIGSSRERLPIARSLKTILRDTADCTVWDEAPQFAINASALATWMTELTRCCG
jgi:hypothetical protein